MRDNLVLMVDSGSDLPIEFIKNPNVVGLPIGCNFKGRDVEDYFGEVIDSKEFYEGLRAGEMYTTSQINIYKFQESFREIVKEGKSIIYLGLSSGLSGTINNARTAAVDIKEEIPSSDITVIDTLSASMGIALLAYKVYKMMEDEKSKEEIIEFVEGTKLKVNHYFTVDDLYHLKRGGRVSSSAAAVGTLLNVKPILHIDNEGKLVPISKARGRKKAISELANQFIQKTSSEPQMITISHGDCIEDARALEKLCRENGNVEECVINHLGPTIGSHTGAGLLALFFIGNER
ncbi:MAG: DegV family protein [Clostridium sp.]|uniref:DegV family protein n=1 Tax=Clostridium sp. TaxID=1506 RepID=UPI003057E877